MTKLPNVTLILDLNFGDQVASVAGSEAIWLVASDANRTALGNLNEQRRSRCTTFELDDERGLERAIELVEEHHNEYTLEGPWKRLRVHGATAAPAIRKLLEEYGATRINDLADGFEALRGG
jgi:hypothetical protein